MTINDKTIMTLEDRYGAGNYAPLPVVLTRGEGVHLWDTNGKRYLDMMSAYSAVSHGHCHPRLVKTLSEQAARLTVVSRAFYSDQLARFQELACQLTGMDNALPMNTGAEAVETALKAARKWAYTVKGIAADKAEIIVCQGNFHGRTIAIVGMSSEPKYQAGFGPFPAGFKTVPYGDIDALSAAINEHTAAFLIEPIQGEGGIIVPPAGYLKAAEQLCRQHNVLLICDEIQCGLGRSGKFLACQHDAVVPDGLILGKALGGGLLPVSLFLARSDVMSVFQPGDHGSTFGGNPLAAAVAYESLQVIVDEQLTERAERLGHYFMQRLSALSHPMIREVRGQGLLIGLDLDPAIIKAKDFCLALLDKGILSRETHDTVVRFAPPLIIDETQIDWALDAIKNLMRELP